MKEIYILKPSTRKDKKYMIIMPDMPPHHFGAKGYEDFTTSGDEKKKKSYLARHSVRENWDKSGIHTSGFWARWLLWNKNTLKDAIKDTEKRFNLNIVMKSKFP